MPVSMRDRCRIGLTLIEVMAALIVAATVAAISLQYLRPAGEASKQRSCDMTRAMLQNDARRYTETTGRMPSTDLRELETAAFAGPRMPTCPVTGERYRRNGAGVVVCPTHEATRAR